MDAEVDFARANRALKFKRPKAKSSGHISKDLKLFLKNVAAPARRNISVPEAFEQIAGRVLAQNCRIESLCRGVMKIKVKPGAYMFELRSRSKQIVEDLRQQCPSTNIREIKLICY